AIAAFKTDFGDIPRPETAGSNSGFATLGRYLIGPYGNGIDDAASTPSSPVLDAQDPPVYSGGTTYHAGDCVRQSSTVGAATWVALRDTTATPSAGPNSDWAQFEVNDNRDGPGIKKPIGGRAYGPYLQPDKFKTR